MERQEIETVVRLFGDQQENITFILRNLQLLPNQLPVVRQVLGILYDKIERLRLERNQLRQQLNNKEQRVEEAQAQMVTLKSRLDQVEQSQQASPRFLQDSQHVLNSISQTPPLASCMSLQLQQNKQNMGEGQFQFGRSVSAFSSSCEWGGQLRALLRKYNMSSEEFRRVLEMYVEEEKSALAKLETESQKELYLQSKRSRNYEGWMRRAKRGYG